MRAHTLVLFALFACSGDTTDTPSESESESGWGGSESQVTSESESEDSTSESESEQVAPPLDTGNPFIDSAACDLPGTIRDCQFKCFPANWVGDTYCDDGTMYDWGDPDFYCEEFQFDGGDCDPVEPPPEETETESETESEDSASESIDTAPEFLPPCPNPLDTRDCDGECYREAWKGDGVCDAGASTPAGSPNFNCPEHSYDDGDCATP